MGCAARQWHHRRGNKAMERPMAKQNDLSRCLVTLEQDATVIAVIEVLDNARERREISYAG
jgi:hypothetical protein